MKLLKAPYLLSENGILRDHAVLVDGERIVKIAPQKNFSHSTAVAEILELPQMILSPGLINAHCHLELSKLPKALPYPGTFVGWIEKLAALKLQMSEGEIQSAIRTGIQKVIEGGATTIANHLSPNINPQPLLESPLDGVLYLEVLGVESRRAEYFYQQASEIEKLADRDKGQNSKFKILKTPHATYSILPEIFSKLVNDAKKCAAPLSVHIAESAEEYLLFKENRGPLAEFLSMRGKSPPTLGESPLQYLFRHQWLESRMMAIHANYLEDGDITILRQQQMSVVHCPGSHSYFGHERFPLGFLEEEGINIALGTDSLASGESLSMLDQMRQAMNHYAELTPESALKMATMNGAKALGLENEVGSIKEGKLANMIGIPYRFPKRNLHENIVLSEKTVFQMIRGRLLSSCKPEMPML